MASRARPARSIVWTVALVLPVCLTVTPGRVAAQEPRATASFAVSVTVVRSCSISTADSTGRRSAEGRDVRVSCAARQQVAVPIASLGASPTPTPVPGASASPGLSTLRQGGTLVLLVNF